MKLSLLSALSVFLALPLLAQTRVQVQADCVISFNFNATGNSATFDNRQAGCETWTLQYQSTGFSVVALTIQSAAGPVTAGAFGTYAGTIDTGINPNTSTAGATTTAHNGTVAISWIRVSATLTGTGTLNGILYGFKNGLGSGGGGGGSGCPNPCPVVGTAAAGAVPSGNPVQVAGQDGTDIRTISTDNTGRVNVNATFTPSGQQDVNLKQVGGTNTVTGGLAGSQGVGGIAAVGAAAGNPLTIGTRDDSNNALGIHSCPDQAAITLAAGTDVTIISGVAATNIRICHISFSMDSSQTVTIRQGTLTTTPCDTTTVALSGAYQQTVSFALDFTPYDPLHTTVAAKDVCIHLGGSATLGGIVEYAQY
jgi:hypothetical protein